VGALASRIVEIQPDSIRDYPGTYEEYVHFCGDDHLDADQVILRAKREKKEKGKAASKEGGMKGPGGGNDVAGRVHDVGGSAVAASSKGVSDTPGQTTAPKPRKLNKWKLQERHKEILEEIDRSEVRLGELDEKFVDPTFYEEVAPEELRAMEEERSRIQTTLEELVEEWGQVEEDLASL
jgi:hypothetical protein